ncbi:MAG: hypothetical protein ACE5OZ_10350 [Candidatus Heimdallarchaeota archaeon]
MKTATIAEIFLSLQGEGTPLILLKPQVFFRFGGCNLAAMEFGTKGCIWCDTPLGKIQREFCRIERVPGSGDFAVIPNPVALETAQKELQSLCQVPTTPSMFLSNQQPSGAARILLSELESHIPTHSLARLKKIVDSRLARLEPVGIAFTGGEPLHQFSFTREIAQRLTDNRWELHLETNATIPDYAEECAALFDSCSADVKDRSARAAKDWEALVQAEIAFIERFVDAGNPNIFAKVVITKETVLEDICWIAEQIATIGIDLVIQPVTPTSADTRAPSLAKLAELEQKLLELLGKHIWINVQMHKMSLALR